MLRRFPEKTRRNRQSIIESSEVETGKRELTYSSVEDASAEEFTTVLSREDLHLDGSEKREEDRQSGLREKERGKTRG